MKVTPQQLFTFLDNREETYEDFLSGCNGETNGITKEVFDDLNQRVEDEARSPVRTLIVGRDMSENHLGGDDLVSLASEVAAAVKDGYEIATWYGPDSEALVVGYKPDYLTVEG